MLSINIPAMRGKMGSRTYYAAMMPMSALANLFKFTDWAEFTPEDREQRVLNVKRVPDLANYMLENEDDYLFASITASYKTEPTYVEKEAEDGASIGILKLKLGDELIINDGQHRCAGIAQALKKNPELANHTISVLLFPYENQKRVQQMFSDLNRFVQKTSKSLDILYDSRDPLSISTMMALEKVEVFKELTEKESISLKAGDTNLFTLAALYDANAELVKGLGGTIEENTDRLVEYWTEVAKHMPDWTKVLKGQKTSKEMRAAKICAHSTVLRAIGGAGADLLKEEDWKARLGALEEINWERHNPEWENVCIIANSVISNRQARAATRTFLKKKLGLELTDGEKRLAEKAAVQADLSAAFKDANLANTVQ
jgi:DNA sulfur modification protein DndB